MREQRLLKEALIEAHPDQHYVPWPASAFAEKVEDLPLVRMASELRMNLYMLDQFGVKCHSSL
jgi:hypothetical protein